MEKVVGVVGRMNEVASQIATKIENYNVAKVRGNANAMEKAESELTQLEAEYAGLAFDNVIEKIKADESPVKAAIIMRSYQVIGHKAKKENGATVGFEQTSKEVQIDLLKVFERLSMTALWKYDAEKLNKALALKAAKELGVSKDNTNDIKKNFAMSQAKSEGDVEIPSNTAVCKALQGIIDQILPEESKCKCNNYDTAYLMAAQLKAGKTACTLTVCKNGIFIHLITNVMHRLLTGKVYALDFKKKKVNSTSTSVLTSAESKKPEPKKEKVSVIEAETVVEKKSA